MALTEIYIDPSIDADSGTGTVGDPYGDLEYGIVQETFDTVNGTRVNVKAGATEILTAELWTSMADTGVSIAWVPSATAHIVIQGYTDAANDGGVGDISGGDLVAILDSTSATHTHFVDIELHNTLDRLVQLGAYGTVQRCEVHTNVNSVTSACQTGNYGRIIGNYFHNIKATQVAISGTGGHTFSNYFDLRGVNVTYCFYVSTAGSSYRNICLVDGGTRGCILINGGSSMHNSFWSDGGTGQGIYTSQSTYGLVVTNNIVAGFSGTGGKGLRLLGWNSNIFGNAVYDCETEYDISGAEVIDIYGDNEILTSSPFTNAAAGDFSPVDTGNVKEGALPQIWNN